MRRGPTWGVIVCCAGAVLLAAPVSTPGVAAADPQSAAPQSLAATTAGHVRTATLDGASGDPVLDARTHTIYVPSGYSDPSPRPTGTVVDVLDANACSTTATRQCRVVARIHDARHPTLVTVGRSDTLYLTNADGTIRVVNGHTCNATVRRGCRRRPLATIKGGPSRVCTTALSPDRRTLYEVGCGSEVVAVDVARCWVKTQRGCGDHRITFLASRPGHRVNPRAIGIDPRQHTLYVAGPGHLYAYDVRRCTGRLGRGCAHPKVSTLPGDPVTITVDAATGTAFVKEDAQRGVRVFGTEHCNAHRRSGCRSTVRVLTGDAGSTVHPFASSAATSVALDRAAHTAYVVNGYDDTLSAIDLRTCTGSSLRGCPVHAVAQDATPDRVAPAVWHPSTAIFVPGTRALVELEAWRGRRLQAVDPHGCDAATRTTCRSPATYLQNSPLGTPLVDPATGTMYAADETRHAVDVLPAAACTPDTPTGCVPVATIPLGHPAASPGVIDPATRTLYVQTTTGVLSVINLAQCTAADTSGCSTSLVTTVPIPGPQGASLTVRSAPELDPVTHSLYVAESTAQISVLDTTTCNAQTVSGCGPIGTLSVAASGGVETGSTSAFVVDPATDTLYLAYEPVPQAIQRLAVVDLSTCNATSSSGCATVSARQTDVLADGGLALDAGHHTLYAVGYPVQLHQVGILSLLDTASCNAQTLAACGPQATVRLGRVPTNIALDPVTHTVAVADTAQARLSFVAGATCNADTPTQCPTRAPSVGTDSAPDGVAIDPGTGTVYAATGEPTVADFPEFYDEYAANTHLGGFVVDSYGQPGSFTVLSEPPAS